MPKKWLRKEALCVRYGDFVDRTIDRAVKDGRLPAPEFPLGNKIPFWDEEKLDEHDRKVVTKQLASDSEATAA